MHRQQITWLVVLMLLTQQALSSSLMGWGQADSPMMSGAHAHMSCLDAADGSHSDHADHSDQHCQQSSVHTQHGDHDHHASCDNCVSNCQSFFFTTIHVQPLEPSSSSLMGAYYSRVPFPPLNNLYRPPITA